MLRQVGQKGVTAIHFLEKFVILFAFDIDECPLVVVEDHFYLFDEVVLGLPQPASLFGDLTLSIFTLESYAYLISTRRVSSSAIFSKEYLSPSSVRRRDSSMVSNSPKMPE
jgi:hypothetical protein